MEQRKRIFVLPLTIFCLMMKRETWLIGEWVAFIPTQWKAFLKFWRDKGKRFPFSLKEKIRRNSSKKYFQKIFEKNIDIFKKSVIIDNVKRESKWVLSEVGNWWPPWVTEENLPIFSTDFGGVINQRNKKVEKTSWQYLKSMK